MIFLNLLVNLTGFSKILPMCVQVDEFFLSVCAGTCNFISVCGYMNFFFVCTWGFMNFFSEHVCECSTSHFLVSFGGVLAHKYFHTICTILSHTSIPSPHASVLHILGETGLLNVGLSKRGEWNWLHTQPVLHPSYVHLSATPALISASVGV